MVAIENRWMRKLARWLGLLCGIWWLAFTALSPAFSSQTLPFGLAILAATAVAWKWEALGGALLVLEGIGYLVFIALLERASLASSILLLLTLALPTLLSGILFIVHRRRVSSLKAPP